MQWSRGREVGGEMAAQRFWKNFQKNFLVPIPTFEAVSNTRLLYHLSLTTTL